MKAVVIGSGPNGLAGALELARAGLDVEVHEARTTLGGGVRSRELTLPGFVHDVCSAIQPLGANSPFFRSLDLDVEWVQPDAQAAHPLDDGTAVLLERDLDATADGLGEDGDAYRALVGPLVEHWPLVEPVLIGPLPPSARALARLAVELGPRAALHALACCALARGGLVRDGAGARVLRRRLLALDAPARAAAERRLRALAARARRTSSAGASRAAARSG